MRAPDGKVCCASVIIVFSFLLQDVLEITNHLAARASTVHCILIRFSSAMQFLTPANLCCPPRNCASQYCSHHKKRRSHAWSPLHFHRRSVDLTCCVQRRARGEYYMCVRSKKRAERRRELGNVKSCTFYSLSLIVALTSTRAAMCVMSTGGPL